MAFSCQALQPCCWVEDRVIVNFMLPCSKSHVFNDFPFEYFGHGWHRYTGSNHIYTAIVLWFAGTKCRSAAMPWMGITWKYRCKRGKVATVSPKKRQTNKQGLGSFSFSEVSRSRKFSVSVSQVSRSRRCQVSVSKSLGPEPIVSRF